MLDFEEYLPIDIEMLFTAEIDEGLVRSLVTNPVHHYQLKQGQELFQKRFGEEYKGSDKIRVRLMMNHEFLVKGESNLILHNHILTERDTRLTPEEEKFDFEENIFGAELVTEWYQVARAYKALVDYMYDNQSQVTLRNVEDCYNGTFGGLAILEISKNDSPDEHRFFQTEVLPVLQDRCDFESSDTYCIKYPAGGLSPAIV